MGGYSILIPAYNTHKYIEECLDSIELQSHFINNENYEILVGIDNCEKTLDKLIEIGGKYRNITILYMHTNMGPYVTINTLLPLVKYDKIITFGSDDIMKPNLISEINKHSENTIIKFDYCNFNQNNNQEICVIKRKPSDGVICYHTKIINELGGYKNWKCSADSDFILRASTKYKPHNILECLYYRRVHSESLTMSIKTGLDSDLRLQYSKNYSKTFEYVEPVINTYDLVVPNKIEDNSIKYNIILKTEITNNGTVKKKKFRRHIKW